jgi:hypothetical protein
LFDRPKPTVGCSASGRRRRIFHHISQFVGWNKCWHCNCTFYFLGFHIYGCNLDWHLKFSGQTSPFCFNSKISI